MQLYKHQTDDARTVDRAHHTASVGELVVFAFFFLETARAALIRTRFLQAKVTHLLYLAEWISVVCVWWSGTFDSVKDRGSAAVNDTDALSASKSHSLTRSSRYCIQ
jgi:hypothetical protein